MNSVIEDIVTEYAEIIVTLVAIAGRKKAIEVLQKTIEEIQSGEVTKDYN